MMLASGSEPGKKLSLHIKTFLSDKETRPEDAEIIPYNTWLRSKFGPDKGLSE